MSRMMRTRLWDGEVNEWIKHTELNLVLPSFNYYAVALGIAILSGVPWVGALSVWPAYGWIYLLIVLLLYLLVLATLHNTASLNTLAVDTGALFLVSIVHGYAVVTLGWWCFFQPLGLVPAASSREFPYIFHILLFALHAFHLMSTVTAMRFLIDASMEVRARKKADRQRRGLQDVNASDEEEEEMARLG